MQAAGEVKPTRDVPEMLRLARSMEEESARDYNQAANECSANADAISKKLFEELTGDEERHYGQYDIELDKIEKFGDRYLALQSLSGRNLAGAEGEA